MAFIEIKDVTKTYHSPKGVDVYALKGINLEIEAGEIFGIIGQSGAGKSTLIRCLNLLERPTGGTVTVDGREMTSLNPKELRLARRETGMIFQHFNLLANRTVAENVAFAMEITGKGKGEIGPRVAELLALVGLEDKAKNFPAQLSGGQKQRVGIARALANKPKILLCDEATSALDPQTTNQVLALIEDIKVKLGLTVILITHEMKVISEICDRVAVMEDGIIVELGSVLNVFTNPQHPTSHSFVEEVIDRAADAAFKHYQPKGVLARIFFIGQSASEPMISHMIKKFNVEASILQGQIDHLKGQPFGSLLLDIFGRQEDINGALKYLESLDLTLEVLGHA